MTTKNGNPAESVATINVTPMIDVLLVLLIIFMVIVPAMPRGESALVPQSHQGKEPIVASIVLEVLRGNHGAVSFKINLQDVARQDLPATLAEIYGNRADRVLFVKGDDQLSFRQMAEVIDIGHSAGVDHIGLLTPGTQLAR
jgi:biopolymer transport protein ExbD